jgi:hypothetical protein
MARGKGKDALPANRYMLERRWEPSTVVSRRGRPSKAEIQKETHRLASNAKQVNDDFERITNPKD